MRILLHGAVDVSKPGGVETHLRELAHGLTQRGHEVEIFGRPESLPPFRMVSRIEPSRYDILHDHATVWPRGLARGRRYLRTVHFCTAEKMATYVRMGRVQTLLNGGNWRAVRGERATALAGATFIAVSERLRAELTHWYGVEANRVISIANGASFAPAKTPRAALRERWGIGPYDTVVLAIGRNDFVKGFDLFERAWRRTHKANNAVWVTVGGDRERRAPSHIVTGPLDREALVDWIHAADIGAFPSYYEGCGIVLLDMLAGGLYTLSHDVGIAREVIEPGGNGLIVPRTEVAWISALETTMLQPSRRAPKLPRSRSWDAMVDRVEQVYREMLSGRSPAVPAATNGPKRAAVPVAPPEPVSQERA